MKQICNGLLALLILFILSSCEDFMDIHKDYVKDGEIIYAPKVDSMIFIAGQNRVMFRYWLYKSPNVRTVDLYWNDDMDSLIIPVTPSAGIDSFQTIIPNLEEKSYTFRVQTTDSYGHKSLFMTNFGTAYGELYRNALSNRRINTVAIEEYDNKPSGIVSMFSAGTGLVRTEVRYQKTDGTTDVAIGLPSKNSVICPYVKPGSSFDVRSLYIPETEAVDTFATDWASYQTTFPDVDSYRYDRRAWEVLEVSDETASDGGGMATVIDGNLSTYWHSQWSGGNAPLPHWVIIDMKGPKNVVKLDVYRRASNTDSKSAECYLGNSPVASDIWTKIGSGTFSSGDKMEIEPTDKTTKGRYLKLVLPDSNNEPNTSIAEIYPYGGF